MAIGYKFFGEKAGLLLSGVLGGIISSTATTASYSKRAAKQEFADSAATVILLASTVSGVLVLIEIAVVAPGFLRTAILPLSVVVATLGLLSVSLCFMHSKGSTQMLSQGNPSELQGSLYFAVLYCFILLAIPAVKAQYGVHGLYVVAAASGLAEVHALTLSTSQLVEAGRLGGVEGWQIIVIDLEFGVQSGHGCGIWSSLPVEMAVLPFVLTMALGIAIVALWH